MHLETQKIGLVLEGGAMRGIFSAGVMDVLMEHDINFDGAVGVSAGAAFGCNYKSRQPGRALRYNLTFCRDSRYCSLRSLLRTGDLYGAAFCYEKIPFVLDPLDVLTYEQNPMAFYVVCTDVDSGHTVYRRCDRADEATMAWYRASASMPLASRPVEIGGRRLLDGGITDSIPLRFMQKQGYGRNVVLLTQPRDYEKKPASPLLQRALGKYPRVAQAMAIRHLRYQEARGAVFASEAAGDAFVILPPEPLPIRRTEHDPEKLLQVYHMGRKEAERLLPALTAFMKSTD